MGLAGGPRRGVDLGRYTTSTVTDDGPNKDLYGDHDRHDDEQLIRGMHIDSRAIERKSTHQGDGGGCDGLYMALNWGFCFTAVLLFLLPVSSFPRFGSYFFLAISVLWFGLVWFGGSGLRVACMLFQRLCRLDHSCRTYRSFFFCSSSSYIFIFFFSRSVFFFFLL